jgi:uncharacterized protein
MAVALVTGASSGLGIQFARQLAARGFDLALTARSAEPMEELAQEVRRASNVKVTVHPLDLSRSGSADALVTRLDELSIVPELVINNAGFGLAERFFDHEPTRLAAMLQLNVTSLTELSQRLGSRMAQRGQGRILLVASMAAFLPSPLLAAYAASKSYILSLGEALNVELAPSVAVTVLSPGLMDTGFSAASGYKTPDRLKKTILSTAEVAKIGLEALFEGRSSVVAGKKNARGAFMTRFLSRHALAERVFRSKSG